MFKNGLSPEGARGGEVMAPLLLITPSEDTVTFGEVAVDLCQDAWASLDPARKILDREGLEHGLRGACCGLRRADSSKTPVQNHSLYIKTGHCKAE